MVPDVAGWRRERLGEDSDEAAIEIAPDWVCEVLSPRTERVDRIRKMDAYLREKVGHVWLVNPRSLTLEVFRLQDGGWYRAAAFEGHLPIRAEPFDAVEIDMGRWWSGPPETPEKG